MVTRWDSSRAMSDRLLEQKPALDAYCTKYRRDLLLSHREWGVVEDVSNLLEPIAELSRFMCRDESPISVQVAVRRALLDEIRSNDSEHLTEERARLLRLIEEKFGRIEEYKYS